MVVERFDALTEKPTVEKNRRNVAVVYSRSSRV
jgi:hypothetical protein